MAVPDRSEAGRILLGAAVRNQRSETGMTLAQLAAKAGLSVSYTSDIERGRKSPGLDSLDALAGALGTDVVTLLSGVYPYGASLKPRTVAPPPDGRERQR